MTNIIEQEYNMGYKGITFAEFQALHGMGVVRDVQSVQSDAVQSKPIKWVKFQGKYVTSEDKKTFKNAETWQKVLWLAIFFAPFVVEAIARTYGVVGLGIPSAVVIFVGLFMKILDLEKIKKNISTKYGRFNHSKSDNYQWDDVSYEHRYSLTYSHLPQNVYNTSNT